ncbi:hypothetical protein JCM10207_007971 [Rhodosporidiobolus poonsookiae]
MTDPRPLSNLRALFFDVFGTLVDWEGSVSRQLKEEARRPGGSNFDGVDWVEFTRQWRKGYMTRTREIANGAPGPGNIDELHLEILNTLLDNPSHAAVASAWPSEEKRKELCQVWHRLDAWPDVQEGMDALKKLDPPVLLASLSNGSLRLLVDLSRHSSLPFDALFSGDLLSSYKPNPKMYLGASALLGFDEEARERGEVGMVASHVYDLRAAAEHGFRTIYIPRRTEDVGEPEVRAKSEGGEVDVVLDPAEGGLGRLCELLRPTQ